MSVTRHAAVRRRMPSVATRAMLRPRLGHTPAGAATTSVWVVVPTFNEAGNLRRVVVAVLTELTNAGLPFRLLIVDDASPDGSGEIADRLCDEFRDVHVLHRSSKQGIGAAYTEGFRTALRSGATHVVQMDADLSHDPAQIPQLVAACERADLAIGSRYMPGGSTPDWSARRRLLSRGGCLYARAWLGLPLTDATGGFKCWRGELLARVLVERPALTGYGFQVEMSYRAARVGGRLVELPICFHDREVGASKMGPGIVREALLRIPHLRLIVRGEDAAEGAGHGAR
jgi:dolichol-phosphate mannosyltransferase